MSLEAHRMAACDFRNNVGVREHVFLAGIGYVGSPELQSIGIRHVNLRETPTSAWSREHPNVGGRNRISSHLRICDPDVARPCFIQKCRVENEGVNQRKVRILRKGRENEPRYVSCRGLDGLPGGKNLPAMVWRAEM